MHAHAPVSIPLLGCSDHAILQTTRSPGLMTAAFDGDAELTGALKVLMILMNVCAAIVPDRQQCASCITHNRHSNMLGVAMDVMGSCNDKSCNLQMNTHQWSQHCHGVLCMLCCRVACVEEGQTKWAVCWGVPLQCMWHSG